MQVCMSKHTDPAWGDINICANQLFYSSEPCLQPDT